MKFHNNIESSKGVNISWVILVKISFDANNFTSIGKLFLIAKVKNPTELDQKMASISTEI